MLSDRRKFIFRGADISIGDFDIFLIGGGGGGGGVGLNAHAQGAGGAGAYVAFMQNIPLIRKSYVCTIGQGGAGGGRMSFGGDGGATSFDRYSVNGGGGGGTAESYPATIKGGSGGTGGGAGGYVRDTSTGGITSQEFFPGSDGGSNGSDGYGNYETSLHDAILLGGDGDGLSKYLFGNTTYDLYCGGGGGGAYEWIETTEGPGVGGAGGGGNGAGAIADVGGSPATPGTKYGAGGGGGCGLEPNGAAGYQGAVFIRKSSGILVAADFTCTGNWRWYRNNASLGIVEIYGNGVFTLA